LGTTIRPSETLQRNTDAHGHGGRDAGGAIEGPGPAVCWIAVPALAHAQTAAGEPRRVGVLSPQKSNEPATVQREPFERGLQEPAGPTATTTRSVVTTSIGSMRCASARSDGGIYTTSSTVVVGANNLSARYWSAGPTPRP